MCAARGVGAVRVLESTRAGYGGDWINATRSCVAGAGAGERFSIVLPHFSFGLTQQPAPNDPNADEPPVDQMTQIHSRGKNSARSAGVHLSEHHNAITSGGSTRRGPRVDCRPPSPQTFATRRHPPANGAACG